jgi:glycosyltransferase involved in cell wall biosynthesis
MDTAIDLTICQECKVNPATYGDGMTWSLCSKCKYEKDNATGIEAPQVQEPVSGESFKHEIVPGLVSIILPVYMKDYALFHYTGNCIGSIREHTPQNSFELVVVDNGSPMKAPDEKSYYAHKVIVNPENLGVTKAWNQGIRMSIGEYIVLINNDVQVFNGWLDHMKKALDEGGYDLVMAHPMYSLTEPFARALESEAQIRKVCANENPKIYTDFVDFSCVMFKRSLLDEVGMFDERFVSYLSDIDLFRRMEAKGKKYTCCELVPTSHISGATGMMIKQTPEIMNKDREAFEEKWPKITSNRKLFRVKDAGDPIYYYKEGEEEYHHVTNPEVLHVLGFEFGDEVVVEKTDVKGKMGEPITMQNYEKYKA